MRGQRKNIHFTIPLAQADKAKLERLADIQDLPMAVIARQLLLAAVTQRLAELDQAA